MSSFALHLAAENKAPATIRIYTEAPRWFAAAHLLRETDMSRWEQVGTQDVQRWMVWLLRHYSEMYAYQQYQSLQQFFRWLAAEDEIADPMARLRAPKVADKPVPFFSSVELSKLDKACQGKTFAQRRDAAILAVFRATGIRLAELAGILYQPGDPGRGDVDLQRREIYIQGKGAKTGSSGSTTRRPAGSTATSGPGPGTRRPNTRSCGSGRRPRAADPRRDLPDGQAARRAGVEVHPHRFRHHFSHTWLERGGAEGDLMELNGWSSPQMLKRYGASARGARARRSDDRIMSGLT